MLTKSVKPVTARTGGRAMSEQLFTRYLQGKAEEHAVPGAAAAIFVEGEVVEAVHGITSTENPLPVDRDTVFLSGSLSKTYAATAVMCLVASGDVDLDAPIQRYLPELRLPDQALAERVTVLQCLNHTGGWSFQLSPDSDEGNDALAASIASMAESAEFSGHGRGRAYYNNAGFALAGRVVEKLTGSTYEEAVHTLLLEPLEMTNSGFHPNELMTRRFAVGHAAQPDGTPFVSRPWKGPRATNPWGGIGTSVADKLTWARFHLGDGDADAVLPAEHRRRMQEPTADMRGSTLGDAVGICWMLREVDGVVMVGHDGSMQNQFSSLLMVPERDFAVVSLSNSGPGGMRLNRDVVRWALEAYAGVVDRDPEPVADAARAREIVGTYATDALTMTIAPSGEALAVDITPTAATLERLRGNSMAFDRAELGLLPREDEYIMLSGQFQGMRGIFTRDVEGRIDGLDFVGRQYTRVEG
jgi:CubicO group peptidase (beta-lactamase class C family)